MEYLDQQLTPPDFHRRCFHAVTDPRPAALSTTECNEHVWPYLGPPPPADYELCRECRDEMVRVLLSN